MSAGLNRTMRGAARCALVLAMLGACVGGAALAQRFPVRWDLTSAGEHSLSPRTRALLGRLHGAHEVCIVAAPASLNPRARRTLRDALDAFEHTPRSGEAAISSSWIDPTAPDGRATFEALVERLAQERAPAITAQAQTVGALMNDTAALLASLGPLAESLDRAGSASGGSGASGGGGLRSRAREVGAGLEAARANSNVVIGSVALPASDRVREALRGPLKALVADLDALRASDAAFSAARDSAARVADALDHLRPLDLLSAVRTLEAQSGALLVAPGRALAVPLENLLPPSAPVARGGAEVGPEARFAAEDALATALAALDDPAAPIVVLVHAVTPPLLDDPASGLGAPATPEAQAFVSGLLERMHRRNLAVVEWPVSVRKERPAFTRLDPESKRPIVWVVIPNSATVANANAQSAALAGAVQGLLDEGQNVLLTLEPSAMPRVGEPDPLAALCKPFGVSVDSARPLFQRIPTARGPVSTPEFRLGAGAGQAPGAGAGASHPIAGAVGSLMTYLPWPSALTLAPAQGVVTAPLLVIPDTPEVWAESQWLTFRMTPRERRETLPEQPTPDAQRDALEPAPGGAPSSAGWIVGAAAERPLDASAAGAMTGAQSRATSQRLVVVASSGWFFDPVAEESQVIDGRRVHLNPGNAELFDASVAWLGRQDDLIAPGPRSIQVSRVATMSASGLARLRWAVILGPPIVILLIGAAVRLLRG